MSRVLYPETIYTLGRVQKKITGGNSVSQKRDAAKKRQSIVAVSESLEGLRRA